MTFMNKHQERAALATRDALAAQVDELQQRNGLTGRAQDPPLVRFRVTALLDSGASLDCGVHLACSVPQLIQQARQCLSVQLLQQVMNWRLDEAKDQPSALEELD
jgi:hypothetical protein